MYTNDLLYGRFYEIKRALTTVWDFGFTYSVWKANTTQDGGSTARTALGFTVTFSSARQRALVV